MRNLLRASYYRYLSSPLTRVSAFVVLIIGLISGKVAYTEATPMSDYTYLYIDDISFMIPMAIAAINIALIAGREFSDHTIRNKLTRGATKAQVFLSEGITGCTLMTVFYLFTAIPLILFAHKGLALLPAGSPVMLFVILLLIFLSAAIVTVSACFISANRTYGVLIAGGLLFLIYLSGYMIERRLYICQEEYFTEYSFVYEYDDDGNVIGTKEIENKVRNEDYLTESQQKAIRYAGNLAPGYALCEVTSYFYYSNDAQNEAMMKKHHEEYDDDEWKAEKAEWEKHLKDKQTDTDMLPFLIAEQCAFLVLLTCCGVLIFRRRNLV